MNLKSTLLPPQKPQHIPNESQWLAGEGAGSWFSINPRGVNFQINRYSPEGKLECSGIFVINSSQFDIKNSYQFVHISHCKTVHIQQNYKTYTFYRI